MGVMADETASVPKKRPRRLRRTPILDVLERMAQAANGMYDAVMVLALLAPLSDKETEASDDFLLFAGSMITIRMVKWYSTMIALELTERRIPSKAEALDLMKHAAWPNLPAIWTLAIAGIAWFGWIGGTLAEDLLTGGNVALMVSLAALARRRAGGSHLQCALYGIGSGLIGLLLVVLKSLF